MKISSFIRNIIISTVMALLAGFVLVGADGLFSPDTLILFVFILVSCTLASINPSAISDTEKALEPAENGALDRQVAKRDQGQVKWFNSSKGFGFITRDDGQDVFVHFRAIRGEGRRFLRDGQRVEFETGQGEKGLQAEDVVVIES